MSAFSSKKSFRQLCIIHDIILTYSKSAAILREPQYGWVDNGHTSQCKEMLEKHARTFQYELFEA